MDRSLSDSELQQMEPSHSTPPNFVSQRFKRKRDDESALAISELREEMKSMISSVMSAQKQGFDSNYAALKEIKQTNKCIEQTLEFLTAQNDEFKKKIEFLERKVNEDRVYINTLENKIETMQQDYKKTNFEIKNAPMKPNEDKSDLVDMVLCLSNTIGCQLNKSDIKDIYRVRGKNLTTKNTPIIVETSSTLLKNEVLKMSKAFNIKQKTKLCAKHLGFRTSEDTPIYLSSQLTAKGARLYFIARDLVKQKLYKYCWTAYGKIYLRKADNTEVILIKSEEQIQDLLKRNT